MPQFLIDWQYLKDGHPAFLVVPDPDHEPAKPRVAGKLSDIDPVYDEEAKKAFNDPRDSSKVALYESGEGEVAVIRTNYSTDWYSKKHKTGMMNSGVNAIILCRSESGEMKVLIGTRDIGPQNPKVAQLICGYFDGDEEQVKFLEELHRSGEGVDKFVFSEAARELDEELLGGLSARVVQSYIVGFVTHETSQHSGALADKDMSSHNIVGFFPVMILGGITCEEINETRFKNPPKDFHEMKNPNWFPLSEMPRIMGSGGKVTMHGIFDIELEREPGFMGATRSVISVTPAYGPQQERVMMKENVEAFRAFYEYVNQRYCSKRLADGTFVKDERPREAPVLVEAIPASEVATIGSSSR